MNKLAIRTASIFAAMTAVIILAFAGAMSTSAQSAPERPTDLTAAATHHDTVSLTWSHPEPATVDHYQVLSRQVDSGTGITQVGTSTTTSFEHDGLEPESTYFYRVRPVNSGGEEGQRSARAEATTPADDTPAPEPDPTPAPDPTPVGPERSDQRNTRGSHATAHVSNIGQTSNTGTINISSSISHAQGFTTGSQSAVYTLSTVGMQFADGSVTANELVIAIYSAAAGGGPDSAVYTLTNPSRLENDGTTESLFTAPANSTLSADTTYFVVATTGISNNYSAQGTSETDEDSGASTGWNIANNRYFRNTAFSNNWSTSAAKIKIAIYPPSTTTLSTDATLSDLELEDNTSTAITLSPSFVPGATTYTAPVVNSVDEITVTPTVNDSTASYEIQDSAGTALTDSDTNTTGFQVDLSEGANTIKVEVTAQDASTETYTVTVTRTPADCETDDIWCATLTVGTHTAGGLTFYGYSVGLGDTTGTLSPNTFTYRAATIGVLALKYDSGATGTLRWGISLLSGTTPTDGVLGDDDFTLHVGTHTFAIDAPGTTTTFTFPDHGLSWTVGDTVTVRLVKNPSSDVTLSDLELEGAGGETITLSPEFAQGTTTYTAAVANRIDTVTLSATKNDPNATVVITSDDDNATPGEAELDLSVGANTLTTTVTAEDASALTYTITATRATAPPVPTDCPTDTDWCTTMTVGYDTLTTSGVDIEYWGYQQDQNNGDLRSTTFSHSGTSYSIADVYREKVTTGSDTTSDDIVLNANPTLPHGTILQLGSRTFTVNAGSDPTLNGIEAWDIEANPLSWTDGQHVTVSLKLPSNDATLSNLVLQDASDDSVLTLDPTFDAATLEYVATVGRNVGEITIIPTPNDTDADHEVQDGNGAALTDADTTQDDFQVSITRGLNTIQVEVTAEDATTQTYTVTVTRPRILVSSTGQTSGGSAETGNRNGNQTKHAQKFTTGSNPAGYTLDEVRIYLGTNGNAAAPVITVNSGSGNNPGAVLYTMTNPATITDETTNTFTAPSGATLEADTNYFVVMENSNTNDDPNALYQVGITTSDGEDSSGLSDWSIDDTGRTGTPGWSATSGNVAFRIQVRGTVDVDPDATTLPELSYLSHNLAVAEGAAQVTFTIELSQVSTDNVTVDYATSDTTAEAGEDYTQTSGTLTFAAGETTKDVSIPILDDNVHETLERFHFTISNPTGATLPAFPQAQVSISDDESPPTATIADVTVDEGATTMTLTLNLSHESSKPTGYQTFTSNVGGTATRDIDYVNFLSGGEKNFTVPAGDTQATLDIAITDDEDAESSETITIDWEKIVITGNGEVTPAAIAFTGTITDNDGETNPVTTLVRNTTQTSNSSSNGTHAQSFQTGTNATGYTITEVRIRLGEHVPGNEQTVAKISEDHGGEPGNVVAALTNPSGLLPEGLNTFTAPAGTTLEPSTTYWVVVNDGLPTGDTWQYAFTSGNDETGETGWEIGNDRLRRTSGTNWNTSTSSLIMAIKGQINYPNLSIIDASATEGDDIVFTVNLSGTSADNVTFEYATSRSGDNSEAIDFTPTSGTGTITAGSTYTTITVPTHDDGHNDSTSSYEGDETFTVTISNPTLAGISQATAKGTILDDERLPTVKFTSSDRLTTEDAGHITNFLTFDVVPPGEQTSYISFTSSGTATAGQDYNIQNTTLTVNANINSITTNIIMVNDNVAELDETAIITVVAASANIQVDPDFSTRTLTIQDNDEHPTLSFTSETYNVNENAGHAVLTVNRTGDSSFPVHVDYETVSRNLAIAGDDYVATSGTLTFQPEEFSKTISVPIIDNNIYKDFGQRFNVELIYSSQSNDQNVPSVGIDTAVVIIINDDPVPTASMANVTANERAGTMTLTLKLSHPSSQDISYRTPDNSEYRGGTATFEVDYEIQYDGSNPAIITVPAGQLTRSFDITLIDDDLEEPDETVELVWLKVSSSQATPDQLTFVGTITDPPICDALGNLENTIIVKDLTGEITQAGQSQFHRIKLDPYRSYLIEAIGQNGEDMLGVEEHPNLTLSNPDIPAIWNARATSKWTKYGDRNDGDQPKNVIRRFLDSDYRTYKVEVNSGTGGTGTYQLKIRENNICRLDENQNAHYQWAGGPKGYPQGSDLPAGTGGRQVLLAGTDWGNDNITRPEMHHVLGDNWNSDRDEDWIGVDLEQGEEYTVRLRTKTSLPERLQATQLKILGMKDANGNNISGTESAGAAGKKVFLTEWTAPSTGRFHIAVGSEGNDQTGTYWLSIFKEIPE